MFQRPAKVGVKLYGEPVKLKFNCAGKGQITDAQDNHISNTMKFVVINTREMYAQLFKYDPTMWREIIFVNEKDAVCVTLIKQESLQHFKNCIQAILLDDLSIAEAVITAKFTPRTNKAGQSYSIIEFSWEKNTEERYNMIAEFVSKNPQVMAYSYLEELTSRSVSVDTDTGEESIIENKVEVKTDGFGEPIKS